MTKLVACRNCRFIYDLEEFGKCPACGNDQYVQFWKGEIYIINVEKSIVAKKINAKLPGKYAIRLSR